MSLLLKGASRGYKEFIELLVAKGADINETNSLNETALMLAAESGNLDLVKWLVEHGAEIDAINKNKETVFHYSVKSKNLTLVKWLVSKGTDIDSQNSDGETPLMLAIKDNSWDIVKFLGSKGVNINLKNSSGRSALLLTFVYAEKAAPEMVEWLISKGADINVKDKNQGTVMVYAAFKAHLSTVKLLISIENDIIAKKDLFNQALEAAAFSSLPESLAVIEWIASQKGCSKFEMEETLAMLKNEDKSDLSFYKIQILVQALQPTNDILSHFKNSMNSQSTALVLYNPFDIAASKQKGPTK